MNQKSMLKGMAAYSANRRTFMTKLGAAGAVIGTAAATRGMAQTASYTDTDVLNFLLNLEYLEAEFYTMATTGQSISTMGINVSGVSNSPGTATTTGGAQVVFSDPAVQAIALELAADERTHVTLLQQQMAGLGINVVSAAKPALNLNPQNLVFANMNNFLIVARELEDIGVTAYAGAAPLLQAASFRAYAERILATEALHSGNIRAQIARLGIATTPPLDGADHLPPPSGSQYFPTDTNAIVESRTPAQVLYLAFGAASQVSGGFFPSGLVGAFNTSAAGAANTDGASITASPNPIHVVAGADGATTISWNAPAAQVIQIHVNSPTGPLFTDNYNTGSMQTAAWVTNGMTFYLQDVSNGKPLTSQNTLATLVVSVVTP